MIKTYSPKNRVKENHIFYIQSKGLHAGKPLKKPIPNSWEINTEITNAFEICFMVYNSNILKNYLRGSVIPFLSLKEYKTIIKPIFANPILFEETVTQKLNSLILLDEAIRVQEEKNSYYKQLKQTIANELLKSFYNKKNDLI